MSSDHEEKKHEALPPSAENHTNDGPHHPPASLPSPPSPSPYASAAGNADAATKESAFEAHNNLPEQPQPQQRHMNAVPTADGGAGAPPPPTRRLKSALKNSTNTSSNHDDDPISDTPNIARICGRSASSCGYCRGSRTWVLGVKNKEGQATNGEEQDKSATSIKRVEEASGKTKEQETNGNKKLATLQNDNTDGSLDMETDSNNDGDGPSDESASVAYGLIFASLSPTCYQQLIDAGWRRSGNHLYKPDNFKSCCPALSIRLNVQRYRASKSQRRVEKRLRRYLSGGDSGDGAEGGHSVGRGDAKTGGDALSNSTELLASLQLQTIEAVRSYNGATSQDATLGNVDDGTLSKLCAFKILKNISKVASTSILQEETIPSDGRIVALSTTACAAVGGRSKGKIEASSLAKHVVEQLKKSKDKIVVGNGLNALRFTAEKGGRVTVYLCDATSTSTKKSSSANVSHRHQATSMDVDTIDAGNAPALHRQESQSIGVVADFLRKARLEMPESYGQGQNQTRLSSGNREHVLTVRSVPSQISASQPEVHRLFAKYQTQIHGDKDCFAPVSGDKRTASSSKQSSPSDDDADLDDASLSGDEDGDDDESTWQRDIYDVDSVYAHLNSRTRMRIKKGYVHFHRFLCETPLPLVRPDGDGDRQFQLDGEGYDTHIPFGSYHQQYRINGVLIAVGVVDVLPHCLSSVYAFYDPDLSRHLELGKYTALREIEWVKRAYARRRELTYYYLGYYIRSCIKMVYKAEYKPSELLCPTTNRWIDFEIAKKILDERSPVRQCCTLFLGSVPKEKNEDDERHSNRSSLRRNSLYTEEHKAALVDSMLLHVDIGDIGGEAPPPITVSMLNPEGRTMVDPLIKEFIDEVGFDVSRRCIIRLN